MCNYVVHAESMEEMSNMAEQYHCQWEFEGRPANLSIIFNDPNDYVFLDVTYGIWEGVKFITEKEKK